MDPKLVRQGQGALGRRLAGKELIADRSQRENVVMLAECVEVDERLWGHEDLGGLLGQLLGQFRNPRQQDPALQIGVREVDV